MSADLSDEVIAKVPSRYYRVPRYFFTVLTVAHNRRYRPTLLPGGTAQHYYRLRADVPLWPMHYQPYAGIALGG